jgi:poly(A) polymerase
VTNPVVVPRADHSISRRRIDPDALRVLYRLHEHRYAAYLVGGSVRDLLLGRQPKDFDIGTDAHPYQIKRLFRNCWIIGRRFRLAHIKFGLKTIEVATFRRNIPELPPNGTAGLQTAGAAGLQTGGEFNGTPVLVAASPEPPPDLSMLHRDNSFGTAEEDAFRRDFTINGLFYDIGTQSVIDYVGGLDDLERRVLRSIGDPRVRFVEDPVRMLRAAVLGARLGFDLDPLVIEAVAEHRALITRASPSRLIEEYYKILRSGYAEASFRALHRLRLLELMAPELAHVPDAVWDSLARLDRYRLLFPAAPPQLTTAILIGSLLMPMGALDTTGPQDRVTLGMLPLARRDIERLRHIRQMLPRLADPDLPPRAARSLAHRPSFPDSLVWLEIFGDSPELTQRWAQMRSHREAPREAAAGDAAPDAARPHQQPGGRRRRRRRRGRRRSRPEGQ